MFSKNTIYRIITLISFIFFTTQSFALESNQIDTWKFEVAPYLWAMNMNGRIQTGPLTAHLNQTFSDILSELKWAGMVFVDAKKNKLGLFANALYASLSKSDKTGPIKIDATNHYGIFSAGASYEVYKKILGCPDSSIIIEPYAGFRYTENNTSLKIVSLSVSNNQHWTDPIIGARIRYNINQQWLAILAGDIGGTNFNNHNSYNVNALIGYNPQTILTNTTIYAGYRLLYQDYITGSGLNRFGWTMKLFGPMLGIGIHF